jgi:hypothetical protein
MCERLLTKGVKIIVGWQEMFSLVREGDISLLTRLQALGEKFEHKNSLGQNLAMFALINRHSSIVELLQKSTNMFDGEQLNGYRDLVGRCLADYLKTYSS